MGAVLPPSLCQPSIQARLYFSRNERALGIGRHDLEEFAQQSGLCFFAQCSRGGHIAHTAVMPTTGLDDTRPNPRLSRRALKSADCRKVRRVGALQRQEQAITGSRGGGYCVAKPSSLTSFLVGRPGARGAFQEIGPMGKIAIGKQGVSQHLQGNVRLHFIVRVIVLIEH